MSLIPIENNFQFMREAGCSGATREHLVQIGEMARGLQYAPFYDAKARAIVFVKDGIHSDPLLVQDYMSLNLIEKMLWFAVQAQRGKFSDQLVRRLEAQDDQIKAQSDQIKALQSQVTALQRQQGNKGFLPAPEPLEETAEVLTIPTGPEITALVPLKPRPEHEAGNSDDAKSAMHRIREQAQSIGGFAIFSGSQGYYRRPEILKQAPVFDCTRNRDGLKRYIFWLPDELSDMLEFIEHDQDLVLDRCLHSASAS